MTVRTLLVAPLLAAVTVGFGTTPTLSGKDYACPLDVQTCLNKGVAKLKTSGWLGIEYDDSMGPANLTITRVVPESPAETAGFRKGDVLVSLNGVMFADNTEDRCGTCAAMKGKWKPGVTVDYVVRRGEDEVRLTPTLASLPPDVMAMMIGMHMLEHAGAANAPE